jgi:hypothetical protein
VEQASEISESTGLGLNRRAESISGRRGLGGEERVK